jgi:hypothetical protein
LEITLKDKVGEGKGRKKDKGERIKEKGRKRRRRRLRKAPEERNIGSKNAPSFRPQC